MNVTENGASGSGNNNNNNYLNVAMGEHMFDKVLTPSDVGKLNRLVIPKQHAENYFPLDDNQNSTVLDFQDRNGKTWRIRYLYWSSSQSYVMTKGWIRFVKDKKLSDGDTVSFHRGYVPDDNERDKRRTILFIDWRHKTDRNLVHNISHHHHYPPFVPPTYPASGYYPLSEYSMPPPPYRRFSPFYHNNQFQERYGYGGAYYSGSPLDHHHHHYQCNLGRSEPLDHHHHHYQCNLGRSEPLVYPTTTRVNSSSSTPSQPPQEGTVKKLRLFGFDVEESSSSGEPRGEMGAAGYSSSSPVVIRDDDEENKRNGKSLVF